VTELRARAEAALVEETGAASVVRQCPQCGSLEHGQPILVGSDLHVSMAYAADLAVIAWGAEPVGIDVEGSLPDGRRGAPRDPRGPSLDEWVRLEALGKAAGTGLADWPHVVPPPRPVLPLQLPEGYIGTIAGVPLGWRWLT
jgi:hypothetical protein